MSSTTASDYYQILQVAPHAEQEVIHAAFRGLAKKYHPDVYQGPDRDERMRAVNTAYAVLGDPVKRAAYDRERQRAAQKQSDTRAASGEAQQSSRQTRHKQQAETGQRQQETTGRDKTATGQQQKQTHAAGGEWGSGWSNAAGDWGSDWSTPLPNEPKRYADYFSPFSPPFEPPPFQAPLYQHPVPPQHPVALHLRALTLLGGTLALLAFSLPWLDIHHIAIFGNSYTQTFTGYDLAQTVGWLMLEPTIALLLIGTGVFAAHIHQILRRWVLVIAPLGVVVVLLFLTQSSSLFVYEFPTTLDAGPWLALAGFFLGLIASLVIQWEQGKFQRTP